MIRFVITIYISILLSSLCIAQTGYQTKLFPGNTKPKKNTATLTSTEQRVGKYLYQVFSRRDESKSEVFRVEIGFYDKRQLVSDWFYGILLEKDANRDGTLDYVWYGGDDTGQRLLWFLSKENQYECVDIFRSAEAAWKKKFRKAAPDLGEVGGDEMVDNVAWDNQAQLLIVLVAPNLGISTQRKVTLTFTPAEFVGCKR